MIKVELFPEQDGCLLVLKQTFNALNDQAAKDLAGWHVHIDVLISVLDQPFVPFSYQRWGELYEEYIKKSQSFLVKGAAFKVKSSTLLV